MENTKITVGDRVIHQITGGVMTVKKMYGDDDFKVASCYLEGTIEWNSITHKYEKQVCVCDLDNLELE